MKLLHERRRELDKSAHPAEKGRRRARSAHDSARSAHDSALHRRHGGGRTALALARLAHDSARLADTVGALGSGEMALEMALALEHHRGGERLGRLRGEQGADQPTGRRAHPRVLVQQQPLERRPQRREPLAEQHRPAVGFRQAHGRLREAFEGAQGVVRALPAHTGLLV